MIILAYAGIGKETLAKNCDKTLFIDIYEKDRKESLAGVLNECILLSDLGYDILLDADEAVRNYLNKRKMPFITIYPSLSLMSKWIGGLKERAEAFPNNKRYQRELEHAKLWYLVDNNKFRNKLFYENTIEVDSFSYDLEYLIGKFKLNHPWTVYRTSHKYVYSAVTENFDLGDAYTDNIIEMVHDFETNNYYIDYFC